MAMNITQIQNINSLWAALDFVNSNSNGVFFQLFLVAIFFIIVIIQTSRTGDLGQSVTIGSFLSLILCFIFGSMGLIPFTMTMVWLFLTIIGGFFLYARSNMD